MNKTTTTSILIPLCWLAVLSNFSSNLLSQLPSFERILSSQARLVQILLYAFLLRFLGQLLFLLPVNSVSITSHIWELISPRMTWPYHRKRLWIIISSAFTTTPTLSRRISVNTLIILSHPTHNPDPTKPRNHASSAAVSSLVSQQYDKTCPIIVRNLGR